MIKYFQKAFKITNDNIILTTPLVLFLFLLSIYIGVAQNAPVNLASSILLLATILFMISAFFAGWLYMVKKAIDLDAQEFLVDQEKAKASFGLIKDIPVGIGEYFFSFIGFSILYVGFIFVILLVSYKVGFHFIGNIGISLSALREALSSSAAMKSLVTSLSSEQLIKLNSWNILFLAVTSIYSFFTMFWPAQIISKTKNPFVGLVKSVAAIFKKPLSSIVLFLYVSFVNFIISFVNAFLTINPILYFVSMLLYFYFLVYVVVLIFLYYDKEMQIKDENYSDSGSDSVGQDVEIDKPSEDE
jgi:hypothetical protein